MFIDQKSVRAGSLEDEFEFLAPKEIKDPDQSKPEDWVDEKKIPDPEDVKPEGYDDIPAEIPDPKVIPLHMFNQVFTVLASGRWCIFFCFVPTSL